MTTTSVRFPDVTVPLTGEDQGTFRVLSRVVDALVSAGHSDAVDAFYSDAAACTDHADVLRLVRATVRTI
jgi:hypothetical protein